ERTRRRPARGNSAGAVSAADPVPRLRLLAALLAARRGAGGPARLLAGPARRGAQPARAARRPPAPGGAGPAWWEPAAAAAGRAVAPGGGVEPEPGGDAGPDAGGRPRAAARALGPPAGPAAPAAD